MRVIPWKQRRSPLRKEKTATAGEDSKPFVPWNISKGTSCCPDWCCCEIFAKNVS